MCILDEKAVLQDQEQLEAAAIAGFDQEPTNREECEESVKVDARFLSFLERDESFLSPWNWKPLDYDSAIVMAVTNNENKQYMKFEAGSFLSYNNVFGSECEGSELINPNQAVMEQYSAF